MFTTALSDDREERREETRKGEWKERAGERRRAERERNRRRLNIADFNKGQERGWEWTPTLVTDFGG